MTTLFVTTEILEEVVLPICICVILPCLIVFFVQWARRNEMNRKTEVALKAIENGAQLDPNFFAGEKKVKTRKEKFFRNLKRGLVCAGIGLGSIIYSFLSVDPEDCSYFDPDLLGIGAIFLLIGAALIAAYFIGCKHFAAEIKAEEEKIGKTE